MGEAVKKIRNNEMGIGSTEFSGFAENAPINIMYCDRSMTIRYVNPKSMETLTSLAKHLPIPVAAIVGSSIDVFHKNPAYQRSLLSNARGMPRRAIVNVGPEKLDLWVSAIQDENGEYLGAMVNWEVVTEKKRHEDQLQALDKSQAMIQFDTDGNILTANKNFLNCMGYQAQEISGKHHRMFCEESYTNSNSYREFWDELRSGRMQVGQFRRVGKGGKEIWIQASYNPIVDESGKVYSVVKYATDITQAKMKEWDATGKVDAISKTQAVIEFNVDGTILTANDNFLSALGYRLDEIKNNHHRIFCDKVYVNSGDYQNFWRDLAAGRAQTGEFKRITKDGREIWISASYNPIVDQTGRVLKVVKFATDITKIKQLSNMAQMVDLSPINTMLATPDGKLVYLNENSRRTLKTLEHLIPKKSDQLVGESIDIFHRVPARQRQIISDPRNLPHRAKIALGNETLNLLVSPVRDSAGNYIGPMVTWEVVSSRVALVKELTDAAAQLAAASSELNASATQMASSSEETNGQANEVAAAAEEVSKGVEVVATNTEEMQASIKEIARNANEASSMSNDTRSQATATNQIIQKLGDSSKEIGNVIKVISSIAQQTNLLALNATIEAARAGDAGRGFAVVANEVKELAKQTATATEEITNKIAAIQGDSSGAVKAIADITQSINRLNDIAGSIAASVEEQMATTNEVARVVGESNVGVQSIATNIKTVSTAADQTSQGASQVLDAGRGLHELAERLRKLVEKIEV
jgi:methyl-accepting chemotaxis protein